MAPLHFELITAQTLELLPREQTVFFFPVGPMEDHGPHLPLGVDLIEAKQLAILAAEKLERDLAGWRAVIMPSAPLGIDSHTGRISITVRGHVLRDWLVDSSFSLTKIGFKHFVCFSGNFGPKQLTAIEDAGRILTQKTRPFLLFRLFQSRKNRYPTLVSASSAAIEDRDLSTNPFWADPIEHGGQRDTSVVLASDPELVDSIYQGLPKIERSGNTFERWMKRNKGELAGYWGSPSLASAESGKKILDERLSDLFPKFQAVWEGANPQALFKSWFSIYPPNKSFFKAWILASALVLLMSLWVFMSFQAMISE